MVLVGIRHDDTVIFGTKISLRVSFYHTNPYLDTLSICATTSMDIFSGVIRSNETDRFDAGLIADEVDCINASVNNIEYSLGDAGLFGKLGKDHHCSGILFGGLDDTGIASCDGHREHLKFDSALRHGTNLPIMESWQGS